MKYLSVETAIQLSNVSKTFTQRSLKKILMRVPADHVYALRDVTLSIQSRQVFGLLGANGAGKTTLIKLVAGLFTPDKGEIRLFGQIVDEKNLRKLLTNVGLVTTNDRTFYWRLSGRKNLDFFGVLHDLPSRERKKKIEFLLDQMELTDIADRRFMTYSTGQKQRFAIARALLSDPGILLFDEVTANLDPLAKKKLLNFVKSELVEKQNRTLLWCTHNLAEAEDVCDNFAILDQGYLVAHGSLNDLRSRISDSTRFIVTVSNWHNSFSNQLSFMPELIDKKSEKKYILRFKCHEIDQPKILRELMNQQVDIFSCRKVQVPLEEIYELEMLKRKKN